MPPRSLLQTVICQHKNTSTLTLSYFPFPSVGSHGAGRARRGAGSEVTHGEVTQGEVTHREVAVLSQPCSVSPAHQGSPSSPKTRGGGDPPEYPRVPGGHTAGCAAAGQAHGHLCPGTERSGAGITQLPPANTAPERSQAPFPGAGSSLAAPETRAEVVFPQRGPSHGGRHKGWRSPGRLSLLIQIQQCPTSTTAGRLQHGESERATEETSR